MALQPGTILADRYRIEEPLGAGGMGAVYRAHDLRLNVPVAIKERFESGFLGEPAPAGQPSPAAEHLQFEREAQLLARLSHPGLPKVTDHFVVPGQGQYLVMEYVQGQDLQVLLRQARRLPVERVMEIGREVCDILEYLHSQTPPVIHRDIKPANLRVTPEGKIVLVDFGVAKEGGDQKTHVAAKAVSEGFSPPEQYGGYARTDTRSDIYSLGATLFAMVSGQAPPTPTDRLAGMSLESLPTATDKVPPALLEALNKAIALSPEDRYQSVGELRRALSNASRAAVGSAAGFSQVPVQQTRHASEVRVGGDHAPGRTRPVDPPSEQGAPLSGARPLGQTRLGTMRWFWAVAAIAVLGTVVGLLLTNLRARDRQRIEDLLLARERQTAIADSIIRIHAAQRPAVSPRPPDAAQNLPAERHTQPRQSMRPSSTNQAPAVSTGRSASALARGVVELNGLMWTSSDNGQTYDWEAARSYCASCTLGGYSNWRLPSIRELASLHANDRSLPTSYDYSVHIRSPFALSAAYVWSKDFSSLPHHALIFDFSYGVIDSTVTWTLPHQRALCVRNMHER